jgi:hypothetical protein
MEYLIGLILSSAVATFGIEVRAYPKARFGISELQADELAYEKSMYGAENVVTGPNGWPAQNTSCRSVPRVGYRLAVPVYCKTVAAIVRARAWVQSGKVVPGREQWRLDRKAARDA